MRSQNHKKGKKEGYKASATTAEQPLASDRHLAGAVDRFKCVASSRRRHWWQICECAERCVRASVDGRMERSKNQKTSVYDVGYGKKEDGASQIKVNGPLCCKPESEETLPWPAWLPKRQCGTRQTTSALASFFFRSQDSAGGRLRKSHSRRHSTSRRWTFGTLLMQHYLLLLPQAYRTVPGCHGSHRGDFKPGRTAAQCPMPTHYQSRDREGYGGIYDTDAMFLVSSAMRSRRSRSCISIYESTYYHCATLLCRVLTLRSTLFFHLSSPTSHILLSSRAAIKPCVNWVHRDYLFTQCNLGPYSSREGMLDMSVRARDVRARE